MVDFLTLCVRRETGQLQTGELVQWAAEMPTEKHESSPALRRLAGAGSDSDFAAADACFADALAELRMQLPSRGQTFREYADSIVRRMAGRAMEPALGMMELSRLYRFGNFSDPSLSVWYDLEEACSMLQGSETCCLLPELHVANIDAYLVEEARLFLVFRQLPLPEEFRHWRYCRQCGYLGMPNRREVHPSFVRRIFKLPDYSFYQPYCPSCGNQKLWGIRTQEARRKYLEQQEIPLYNPS